MSYKNKLNLLTVMLCLSACNTAEQYDKMCSTWVGAPENALIQGWGTPTRTYTVGDIKYITFRDSQIYSTSGVSPSYQTTFIGNIATTNAYGGISPSVGQMWCETTFWIRYHRVIGYKFEGNSCIAPIEEDPDYVPQSATSIVW